MKKLIFLLVFSSLSILCKAQRGFVDFDTTTGIFECNPVVFTTTLQRQCVDSTTIKCTNGDAIIYYNTDAASFGQDCRNWFKLVNPGFSFIGTLSELQFRGAGGGNMPIPARFVVRNFAPGNLFAIQFDVALAGYGGEFMFRCGSGDAYQDSSNFSERDSSSFMVFKFDDGNPAVSAPRLLYSRSLGNSGWPLFSTYSWSTGNGTPFARYQKHTIALYCNNSNDVVSYNYIYPKMLNPRSYDLYIDSIIDVDNRVDSFYEAQKDINSIMFCRSNAFCANSGLYRGDTLILDNIVWTTDFVNYILPIELTVFHCTLENNKPKLSWQTASESNNQKFEIERSSDGTHFEKVGEVTGAGNSNQLLDYSWIDSSNILKTLFYYRIKQVDFDHKYTYSDICDIKIDIDKGNFIFPNPFTDCIHFSKPNTGTLFNSLGQKIIFLEDPVIEIRTEYLPQDVYYFIPTLGSPIRLVK
jgi:hypothetical protein